MTRMRVVVAATLLLWGAGSPESRAAATGEVQFETADGFTLHADLTPARDRDAPVAILLHMYRSNRKAWKPLVPRLHEAGLTVLALDQRAHGESTERGEETVRVERIPRAEFTKLVRQGPADVGAALEFLKGRGFPTDRVLLVGASYGCTVALLSSVEAEGVKGLVLLSPGMLYFGIDVAPAARTFVGGLMAVAAQDDPRATEAAETIVRVHGGGPVTLTLYGSGGHGTNLFSTRADLIDAIVEFADQLFSKRRGTPPPAKEGS